MSILIGSTGFVGGHLQDSLDFDQLVHRPNLAEIAGRDTDLLVCAGLPAEKWRANRNPEDDWVNMTSLAEVLAGVHARRAILISTIDVYQPPEGVSESDPPSLRGTEQYGVSRAWFEYFFGAHFRDSSIVRLPGLFASDLRKNLIYDLLNDRVDQLAKVHPQSTFQYFDLSLLTELLGVCEHHGLSLLNVVSEPIAAHQIAEVFGVTLDNLDAHEVHYNVTSRHSALFNGGDGYLFSREDVLAGIARLV